MLRKIIYSAAALTLASGLISAAQAMPVTFSGDSGFLAASVTFDVSGTNLLVRLSNTSLGDPSVPSDILTGVFFKLPGNPSLTKVSAALAPGSTVIHGPDPATDPWGGVGGEWAYTNDLSGGRANQQAIYSSGYFDGNALFPGTDLQGPAGVDGIQYGITSLHDTPDNDNGGLSEGLISNAVDFTLSGLPSGFQLSWITNVWFQYGTGLNEPGFPGDPDDPDDPHDVPEPRTLALLAIGFLGWSMIRSRMHKGSRA